MAFKIRFTKLQILMKYLFTKLYIQLDISLNKPFIEYKRLLLISLYIIILCRFI